MTIETALDRFPTPPCAKTLGWRLIDADTETGWVRVGFEAAPEFCNAAGDVQGGFLAAMLDDTLGPTVVIRSDGTLVSSTINLNISYLARARPGPMVGEARVVQTRQDRPRLSRSSAARRGRRHPRHRRRQRPGLFGGETARVLAIAQLSSC